MIFEKEIEAAVITKFNAALTGVDGIRVIGTWQATNDGEVKGVEEAGDRALVAVATSGPAFDSFTVPTCDVAVAVSLTIRRELAPTAAEIETYFGPLEALLVSWNALASVESIQDLTTTHFRADGVRLDAGSPPQYLAAQSAWMITRAFTVRGVIINN